MMKNRTSWTFANLLELAVAVVVVVVVVVELVVAIEWCKENKVVIVLKLTR